LQIDLGQTRNITRYVIYHAGTGEDPTFNTRDFKFQVSNDGTTWTDVDSVTGNTANTTDHNVTASGRYVRLYITNPQTNVNYIGARIYEFKVYGTPTSTPISLQNAGFEQNPIDANGWWRGTWSGSPSYTWATDAVHSGTYSAKVVNATGDDSGYAMSGNYRVGITAGKNYTVGAWIKTSNVASGNGARIFAQFYNSSGVSTGSQMWSASTSGTVDWTNKTINITAPSDAATIDIEVRLQGAGTAWFDDVTLTQNN
jgi:hypothetical protein